MHIKDGIINSGVDDIVMTERISDMPCSIINTDAAKKMEYKKTWFDKLMTKNIIKCLFKLKE